MDDRKIIIAFILVVAVGVLGFGESARAEIIFQSKWASTGSGIDLDSDGNADPNDGGNWYYAYHAMATDSELLRVSGDESNIGNGGPGGPPPLAPNTTYYLRMERVGNNLTDGMIYLQDNFDEQSDVYGGMWFYFEDNMTFINSVKLFDFKDGDAHATLFGLTHQGEYCCDADYGCNYGNIGGHYGDWPNAHTFSAFKYRRAAGEEGCSEMLNYWESQSFMENLDTNSDPIPSRSYDSANVNRKPISTGKWMALITHVRYHATDGVIEAWIYDGNALTKVMEWNKNTVWNAAGSEDGHDFYTFSRNGNSANQLQVNAYWNGWTGYVGTKYAWISNVIIATSFDDVASYLGVSSNDTASPARTNPSPNGTLPSGTTSTNISLTTDKQAICRYSNISDTNYTDMEYNFTDTNSTNHSTLVTGLENGQTYTFYVRCNSTEGYVNDDDFNISFSIGGHKADLNDDGIINMPELISFIARWKACDGVSKEEVEEARDIWFTGGVY